MKIVKKIFSSRNFQNELLQMYIIFLEKSYTKKFNLLSKQINNFIESKLLEFNNYRIKHLIDYNKLNENYDELNKKYNNLNIEYQKLNNNSKILNNKKNKENTDLLLNNLNIIRFM